MEQRSLLALVVLNVLVHLAWLFARDSEPALAFMAAHFLVSVGHLGEGHVWTLLTSAFSHLDSWHLIFNLFGLWMFGSDVLAAIGGRRFVALYVIGGILGSVGHLAYQLATGTDAPALGASGAVSAISVVYAVLYPSRVLYIRGFLPAPAPVAVGGYLLLDVIGLSDPGSGIAHGAHLGGALWGLLYGLYLRIRYLRG